MNEQNATNNGKFAETYTWTHPTVKYTQIRTMEPISGVGVLVTDELFQQFKQFDKAEPDENSMICYCGGNQTFIPGVTIDRSVTPMRLVAIKGQDPVPTPDRAPDCVPVKPKSPELDDFLKFASQRQEIHGEFRNALKSSIPSPTYPKDPTDQATKEKLGAEVLELTRKLEKSNMDGQEMGAKVRDLEKTMEDLARSFKVGQYFLGRTAKEYIQFTRVYWDQTKNGGTVMRGFNRIDNGQPNGNLVMTTLELLSNYDPVPETSLVDKKATNDRFPGITREKIYATRQEFKELTELREKLKDTEQRLEKSINEGVDLHVIIRKAATMYPSGTIFVSNKDKSQSIRLHDNRWAKGYDTSRFTNNKKQVIYVEAEDLLKGWHPINVVATKPNAVPDGTKEPANEVRDKVESLLDPIFDQVFQPAIHPYLAVLRREKEIMVNAMTAFIAQLPKGQRFALYNDPSMIIELQSNDPVCTTHTGQKEWAFRNVTKSYDVVISSVELLANYRPIPEPTISTVCQRSQYNALANKFNDLLFSLATQFGARREGEDFTVQGAILTLELMRNEISELRRRRDQGNASILKAIFGDAPVRFGLCGAGKEIDQNVAQRTVQYMELQINSLANELLGLKKLTTRISEDLRNCALRHRLIGNCTPDQYSLDEVVTYIINYIASLLVKLEREQKARAESEQQCRNLSETVVKSVQNMVEMQTGQSADKSAK